MQGVCVCLCARVRVCARITWVLLTAVSCCSCVSEAAKILRSSRRVVVFTGAGMSRDSGIAVSRAGVLKLHKRLTALEARAWPSSRPLAAAICPLCAFCF